MATTVYEAWVGINLRGYVTIEHAVDLPMEMEEIEEEIKERIYKCSDTYFHMNVDVSNDFDRDEINIIDLDPVNGEGEKHANHSKQ